MNSSSVVREGENSTSLNSLFISERSLSFIFNIMLANSLMSILLMPLPLASNFLITLRNLSSVKCRPSNTSSKIFPSLQVSNPLFISTPQQSSSKCITFAINALPLLTVNINSKWYDSDKNRLRMLCNITTLLPPPLLPPNDDGMSTRDDDNEDVEDAGAHLTPANNPLNNPSQHQPYLILSSNA